MFIASWLDPIWTGHLGLLSWMIWFCNWLLSFEWVSVVSAPFGALADLLQQFLEKINWIPFALAIAGGVAGLAIMVGRHARGWSEIFISATCAVLATGMLANPIATLTAAGGAMDTAQQYGERSRPRSSARTSTTPPWTRTTCCPQQSPRSWWTSS